MKLLGELFGNKSEVAAVVDDSELQKVIESYKATIQSFQHKLDEHRSKLFELDQQILQSVLFNQEKAVECLISRNDYEDLTINNLKINIDLIPHPIVKQLCFANYFLSLHCTIPQITHNSSSTPTKTYQHIADLGRASIRAKSLAMSLEKVTKLLSACPNAHVSEKEKTFFNFHLRTVIDSAISVYQQYLNSFINDQYVDKLHTTFNEQTVPKAFHPLLDNKESEKTPEEIFTQLIACIVQAIKYLEQDPVHKNSLPCVEALTASRLSSLNNTNN